MSHRELRFGRWGWMLLASGAAFGTGCGDLLGFQDAVVKTCVLNTDCPGPWVCISGVCTPQCRTNKDCESVDDKPVCENGLCVATMAVSTSDGSTDAAPPVDTGSAFPEAAPSGDTGAPDTASAEEGGEPEAAPPCDSSACPQFEYCAGGPPAVCTAPTAQGSMTGDTYALISSSEIKCFELPIAVCGELTGFGIVFYANVTDASVQVGLYEDNGGMPTTLLAETGNDSVGGDVAKLPVTNPVRVGCDASHDAYWVCIDPSTAIAINASMETQARWTEIQQKSDFGDGGLPDAAPQSNASMMAEPAVYALVVQDSSQ